MEINKEQIRKSLPFVLFAVIFLLPIIKIQGIVILAIITGLFFAFKNLKLNNINLGSKNTTIDLDHLKNMKNAKSLIIIIVAAIFALWLFFASIVIIDAGETGVYSLFGKVRDQELSSGFHLVIPLAKVTKISIRTEEYTMSIAQGEGKRYGADAITSLTKEGLSVDLDMTVLYRIKEEKASDIYRTVGVKENVDEKIIRPTIRTAIRDVIAHYEAKDIYSEKREEAADKIAENLKNELGERGIIIEQVLLRNVALPANLANAIQEKLQAEQEAQKYDFILQKEKKEKERKIIEAEGQRDAQKIINESLSTNYLYYLYIKDLKEREGTIYVPTNPSTGMPLFRELGR
ncbi:MAG: prohibitin family protein [Patescibacteria group bacterium]|nr:prohibitin family protein [Patescibacteria group bacterium]